MWEAPLNRASIYTIEQSLRSNGELVVWRGLVHNLRHLPGNTDG